MRHALGVVLALISTPCFAETASYYGGSDRLCGRPTANGERLRCSGNTAASRSLPFGTYVRVTHSGRSVVVRINDRGPFHRIRGSYDRDIDLSIGAARRIGCGGVCNVQLEILGTQAPWVPRNFTF